MTATFGDQSLSFEVDGRATHLRYADCEQAEDAGGLIYVWPRNGAPIVVPTRALADANEAARLVASLSDRIRRESAACAPRIDPPLLRLRRIGRVGRSLGGVRARRRGRRRMQRRQVHVVAARRQRRLGDRLIGIGRGRVNG